MMKALEDEQQLIVFSDDWGRHPSSCQHLVSQLLPKYHVYWMNTLGTRRPGFDLYTLGRGTQKLKDWLHGSEIREGDQSNPRVINTIMWPTFGSRWSRALNARLMSKAVNRATGAQMATAAVTTVPIVADLVGRLNVSRWVYYCVDDLSAWPGLDKPVLEDMERTLVERVDLVIAASEALVERISALGRPASLLTHGVDLDHWTHGTSKTLEALESIPPPLVVFWGVLDRRLDRKFLSHLSEKLEQGTIILAGPLNNPDPALSALPNLKLIGTVPYRHLPALAQESAALIMPYADLPATRVMQPLKLKEYLATNKPVITSALPSVAEWSDACDVANTADQFADLVLERLRTGTPPQQIDARGRVKSEGWAEKAIEFEKALVGANLN